MGAGPKCLEATGLNTDSFLTYLWAPPLTVSLHCVGTALCESKARAVISLQETSSDFPMPLTDSMFYLLTEFYRAGFHLILPHPSLLFSFSFFLPNSHLLGLLHTDLLEDHMTDTLPLYHSLLLLPSQSTVITELRYVVVMCITHSGLLVVTPSETGGPPKPG